MEAMAQLTSGGSLSWWGQPRGWMVWRSASSVPQARDDRDRPQAELAPDAEDEFPPLPARDALRAGTRGARNSALPQCAAPRTHPPRHSYKHPARSSIAAAPEGTPRVCVRSFAGEHSPPCLGGRHQRRKAQARPLHVARALARGRRESLSIGSPHCRCQRDGVRVHEHAAVHSDVPLPGLALHELHINLLDDVERADDVDVHAHADRLHVLWGARLPCARRPRPGGGGGGTRQPASAPAALPLCTLGVRPALGCPC